MTEQIKENLNKNDFKEENDIQDSTSNIKRMRNARWIPIQKIIPDPKQPRKTFIPSSLQEMARSIRQYGVRQPIVVEYDKDSDHYKIVSGERRFRASRIAEIGELPCIIQDPATQPLKYAQQLVENIHREDFSPIDKAKAMIEYKKLLGDVSWPEVEKQLGISESRRKQFVALLNLPDKIQQEIVALDGKPSKNQITEKHARALLALKKTPEKQKELFDKIKNSKEPISGEEAIKKAKQIQGKITLHTFKIPYTDEKDLLEKLERAIAFFKEKLGKN